MEVVLVLVTRVVEDGGVVVDEWLAELEGDREGTDPVDDALLELATGDPDVVDAEDDGLPELEGGPEGLGPLDDALGPLDNALGELVAGDPEDVDSVEGTEVDGAEGDTGLELGLEVTADDELTNPVDALEDPVGILDDPEGKLMDSDEDTIELVDKVDPPLDVLLLE